MMLAGSIQGYTSKGPATLLPRHNAQICLFGVRHCHIRTPGASGRGDSKCFPVEAKHSANCKFDKVYLDAGGKACS